MLDLWTLRVVVAVADAGSFSGATDRLALTQPAVSRQIANMERRLGVALFDRLPRGVRPTYAGEVAIEQARAILARVADLDGQLEALAGLAAGRVRISAFPSTNTWLVPWAIARFAQRFPGVEVSLLDVPSKDAAHAVRAGRLDLALITDLDEPATADGVQLVHIMDDALFIALPRDHRLAGTDPLPLSELGAETWIEGAHPDCLGQLADLHRAIGAAPRIGYVCDDWNGKQALVAGGLGIMVFPALATRSAGRDIVLRRPSPTLPPRRIHLVTPVAAHRSAAVTAMTELLVRLTRQHAARSRLLGSGR